jgi:hypothetical protein
MMTKLAEPLAQYFAAANAHQVEQMLGAFTQDGVVRDEGREYRGSAAIREWMEETIEKFDYQVEPLESSRLGRKTVVLASIRGNLPGSPITLQYAFTFEGARIARLEIG